MKTLIKDWILSPMFYAIIKKIVFSIRNRMKYNNADFIKNSNIRNTHTRDRCFIIGLGKSINEQDLTLLENEIVIGISSLFNHKDLEKIQPNYYVLSPVIEYHSKYTSKKILIQWLKAMDNKLNDSVIMFIHIGDKKYIEQEDIFKNKTIYWVNYLPWNGGKITQIELDKIPSIHSVSEVALSVALYLGFKKIYMLGFDLSWYEGVYNYFDNKSVHQYFGKDQHDVKKEFNFDSESEMRVHAEVFKKFKALYKYSQNIYNANANQNTYVDTFPKY